MSFLKSLFKKEKIRTRFAPSPTGPFHIGSARTALFNFLFAKKYGGQFILRIEDTDIERSEPEYEKGITDGLEWLNIRYDEGPCRQSSRLDIYSEYLRKLLNDGNAFYCFHSKEFLEEEAGLAHHCDFKKMRIQDLEKRLKKENAVIRFKTPFDLEIAFNDLIRGEIRFNSNALGGDFSLAKTKGPDKFLPLYNFAVVIDDFEMNISHVIRGEDHISNTPKQILLQQALKIPTPKYAHLPLILGPDRTKLSKRHGTVGIRDYKKEGYLPEALVNFMAFLGWNPGDEREIYSLPSLIKELSLERIQKGGAIFNIKRLDFLNGFYIRQRSSEKLTELCLPYLLGAGFIEKI